MSKTLQERFEAKYIPEPNSGCWLWFGATRRGYGNFWDTTRPVMATHFALRLVGRPVSPGAFVCHHCDNPACVNPDHLFVGNCKSNTADKVEKKRHLYGEKHRRAKLTDKQVSEIRQRVYAGETRTALAQEYGVSIAAVSMLCSRITWRHI